MTTVGVKGLISFFVNLVTKSHKNSILLSDVTSFRHSRVLR